METREIIKDGNFIKIKEPELKTKKNTSDYKSFTYMENGEVSYSPFSVIKCIPNLDPGFYSVEYLEYPHNRIKVSVEIQEEASRIYEYSNKEMIDEIIDSFLNNELKERIEKLGFNHKLGILFYGEPGSGKSTIMKHYSTKSVLEKDAIIFQYIGKKIHFPSFWAFVRSIRSIQDNPIIIIFDEFDSYFPDNESILKPVIDGNMSISNCLFLASTNYLSKIPKPMTERPSRFKHVIEISGIKNDIEIGKIVNSILGNDIDIDEMETIVNTLSGQTIDNIKHYCFDKLMKLKHNKTITKAKVGFL